MPLSHQHNSPMDVVRLDLGHGRDRAQDQVLARAQEQAFQSCKLKTTCLCKLCAHVCIYFGVFYNSRNYANPHFREAASGYNLATVTVPLDRWSR